MCLQGERLVDNTFISSWWCVDNTFCYLDYSWLHRFGFGRSSLVGWCCLQIDLPEKNDNFFSSSINQTQIKVDKYVNNFSSNFHFMKPKKATVTERWVKWVNTSDNVTQNWLILRHIKALNKGHGDEEPEKSWKHDGSGQPSCRHPGWKIRSQMVLVVTRIKIVTGGAVALQTLSVCLSQGSMYVWN